MKWMLSGGAILGALAVAGGAFGAHALEGLLSARALGWYDTAVTYHATHALALFGCGLLARQTSAPIADPTADPTVVRPAAVPSATLRLAALAFVGGVALFSGSLYAMAFTGWTRLGMVTPFGGLLLIVGWGALAVAAARLPSDVS